ncbi:hypothetical protein [Rugamonas apoptosis]|uniref:Uncharacterized protein n=1 Tax=Rugamonas apoptosis TaxID=2758570 RepID=A0A7W2FB67_9BURK|nr:hypothetical protein [Rugamonas apoptosis]MBA5688465.1 hypothetical protein [Rugamonas apoptosis]
MLMPVIALAAGVFDYRRPHGGDVASLAFALAALLLIFCWFHLDATQRHYRRSAMQLGAMLILPALALPWYLFRSRGALRGAVAIGKALLLLLATMSCYGLGARLAA